MAQYPDEIYTPRTLVNKPGTAYDEAKTSRLFAEDQNGTNEEIVAVQEELGTNPKGASGSVKERIEDIETLVPTAPFLKSGSEIYRDAKAKLINAIYGIITPANIIGLWIFDSTSGTTITDRGLLSHNLTTNSDISTLTKGYSGLSPYIQILGNAEKYNAGDHSDFSFGNGATDNAFSIVSLCYPQGNNNRTILAKYDVTTGATKREFRFYTDSSQNLLFALYDESANAVIARRVLSETLPLNKTMVLTATYDGSATVGGLKIYRNGIQIDNNSVTSGTYIAMENTTTPMQSLIISTTGSEVFGFYGLQNVLIIAKEQLTQTQITRLQYLLFGYANIAF
jgi:hypothetical protein